jgi:hypothetical protein
VSRELTVICDVCPPKGRPAKITVPAHQYHDVSGYLALHGWDCRNDAFGDVCPLHPSGGSASTRGY